MANWWWLLYQDGCGVEQPIRGAPCEVELAAAVASAAAPAPNLLQLTAALALAKLLPAIRFQQQQPAAPAMERRWAPCTPAQAPDHSRLNAWSHTQRLPLQQPHDPAVAESG